MSANEMPSANDPRPSALGTARLLFVAFVIFGVYALIHEIMLIQVLLSVPIFSEVVSFIAIAVWFIGTAGLIHNGRRMRLVAAGAFIAEIVASLVITIIGLFNMSLATTMTMLGMAGAHYYYIPFIGSIAALGWLVWSNPRRLAARA